MSIDHNLQSENGINRSNEFVGQSQIPKGSDGWLTTLGTFYKCSPEKHDACANFLLDSFNGKNDSQQYTIDRSLPSRINLENNGFVLVRNGTIPSLNPNLTPIQINKLLGGKITITDPDFSTECSPSVIQEVVTQLKEKIPKIKEYSKLTPKEEAEDDTPNHMLLSWQGIEEFQSSPLTTQLHKNCINVREAYQSPTQIFDLLSFGYSESIELNTYRHGYDNSPFEKYFIRILPIPNNPNLFTYVQMKEYSHDGQSMIIWGTEYDISTRIKSPQDIVKDLKNITQTMFRHRIKKNNSDYLIKDPNIISEGDSPLLTSLFKSSQLPTTSF